MQLAGWRSFGDHVKKILDRLQLADDDDWSLAENLMALFGASLDETQEATKAAAGAISLARVIRSISQFFNPRG